MKEHLIYVDAKAGGAFIDPDKSVVTTEEHRLFSVHFALLWLLKHDIDFVGHEAYNAVLRGYAPDLFEPILEVLERFKARDVEHEDHAVGTTIVMFGDRTVLLSPSCVPQLHVDHET